MWELRAPADIIFILNIHTLECLPYVFTGKPYTPTRYVQDREYPSYMGACNYTVATSPGVILSLAVLHTEEQAFLCANFWFNFLTKFWKTVERLRSEVKVFTSTCNSKAYISSVWEALLKFQSFMSTANTNSNQAITAARLFSALSQERNLRPETPLRIRGSQGPLPTRARPESLLQSISEKTCWWIVPTRATSSVDIPCSIDRFDPDLNCQKGGGP